VLAARASEVEAQLSYGGLVDLLDGVDLSRLRAVPAPQLRALEVALLRSGPTGAPPATHAIGLGLLNTIRALTTEDRVLLAIDDVQWLDAPSADALAFAARRLRAEPVAFLLARRPGRPSALEEAFGHDRLAHVEVGGLSLGAVRQILFRRLGLTLPRHRLRQIVDLTDGNPLFALELGRELVRRGGPSSGDPSSGDELPLPDGIEDLLETRVADLSPSAGRLLLAVALSADADAQQLVRLTGDAAFDEVVEAGLVVVDGRRVRPAHPLYAAAARTRANAGERQSLRVGTAPSLRGRAPRRRLRRSVTAPRRVGGIRRGRPPHDAGLRALPRAARDDPR
jgi:hypothetical protein